MTAAALSAGISSSEFLAQHRLLERPQLLAGLEPELADEEVARLAVRRQRVGLSARAVEREHELAAQPLAQGVLRDETLRLRHELRVPPEREIGIDAILERSEAQLLQPLDVDAGERLERQIGERTAAPQRERLAQPLGGTLRRVRRQRAASFLGQVLEAMEIELAEPHAQEVSRRARQQDAVVASALPERGAQARDVDLQRVCRARRWPLAPQLVDQGVRRNDLVGAEEEDRTQRALLPTAERNLRSVVRSLERAENPELHRARLERMRSGMRAVQGVASILRASRRTLDSSSGTAGKTHEEEATHAIALSAARARRKRTRSVRRDARR
jgi:hypothetical protein